MNLVEISETSYKSHCFFIILKTFSFYFCYIHPLKYPNKSSKYICNVPPGVWTLPLVSGMSPHNYCAVVLLCKENLFTSMCAIPNTSCNHGNRELVDGGLHGASYLVPLSSLGLAAMLQFVAVFKDFSLHV